jgi:6,7-dimethyl-8-ribityllumazine synthase
MNEHTDEPEDWPLRDWSTRLRPPGRTEPVEEEPVATADEPEILFEESEEPKPGTVEHSEAELVAPEVEEPAAPEVEEPAAPEMEEPAAPEMEEPVAPEVEEPVAAAVEEHVEGEFQVPDGYAVLEGTPNGNRRSVAVVVGRFNGEITNRLLDAALGELEEAGVAQDAILVMPVPGAFELPIAAMALAKPRRYSCVIALGCVIRGETPHFDFVAGEAASGLQLAGIETGVPVSFGVLTCDTAEQAEARIDRGAWAARSALEMADVFAQLRTTAARQ